MYSKAGRNGFSGQICPAGHISEISVNGVGTGTDAKKMTDEERHFVARNERNQNKPGTQMFLRSTFIFPSG